MSPQEEAFVEFAQALQRLGATEVTAGDFNVKFARPVAAPVTAPFPRAVRDPGDDDRREPEKPRDRAAMREYAREMLTNG